MPRPLPATSKSLKEKFRTEPLCIGMQCFSGSPVLVEILGLAGFDWVSLDTEHSPTGLESIEHLARAARANGLAPLVRVPSWLGRRLRGWLLTSGLREAVGQPAYPDHQGCRRAGRGGQVFAQLVDGHPDPGSEFGNLQPRPFDQQGAIEIYQCVY